MIVFDNELVEKVCEQLLTKKENELKLVHYNPENFVPGQCTMIPTEQSTIDFYSRFIEEKKMEIAALEKAITIGKLVILLNANMKEV